MPGSAQLRRRLVEQLEARGALRSPAIRRAFLAVPRERFLSEIAEREGLERVYRDEAIVTRHDAQGLPTSSSSQPGMMSSMLEQLDLEPGQRVLEIGAGTGYNAALLARLVGSRGKVVSVELDAATAREARRALADVEAPVRVVRGDGREGWPRGAPYDRIIVTASTRIVAQAWHDQLRDGGLLELPLVLDETGSQMVVTLRRHAGELRSQALLYGGFMPLRDAPGGAMPAPPPSISAVERIDGGSHSIAHLSGAALGGLSRARRQHLLTLALSEPRRRPLGLRAPRSALAAYLAIEAPADRFILGWPRVGVMSAEGDGLALLAGGRKTFTQLDTYGAPEAEHLLLELLETWQARGRPTAQDLRVDVSFTAKGRSDLRLSWPARKSGLTTSPSGHTGA